MEFNLTTVLTALGLLFGGGGIGAILQVFLASKKLGVESRQGEQDYIQRGFELAVKVVTNQRDDAIRSLENQTQRIDDLELEIAGLKLSSGFDPFPRWMVDLENRYLFINGSFEEKFIQAQGLRRRDVIGKNIDILWPESFVKKMRELDSVARTRPDGRARAVTSLQVGELVEEVTVYKFPVRVHGVIVAYAGYMMENF